MIIYESMIKNLKLIPNGISAKLLLRHSIRPETSRTYTSFSLGLTREGEELAKWLGRYLGGHLDKDFKVYINKVKTSKSPRCMDTSKMILEGYGKNIPIQEEKILHSMWIKDEVKWQKLFEYYNNDIKILLQKMLNKEDLDGVYPINLSIAKMLQVMDFFDTTNIQCNEDSLYMLDIFTTHDSLIMLLLLYLLNKNILEMTWMYMLEGCILWFENSILCIAWRGDIYHIELEYSILREIVL